MKRYDLIIVGAGPSGLSAAIEASKYGLKTIVFDENDKPGGQLFKQIHKFFGSKEHMAKIRGYKIGEELLKEAYESGVEVMLNSVVIGIYQNKEVIVKKDDGIYHYKSNAIIVSSGASENMVAFEGWTLPGVIGAGAAQTMLNIHGIRPGKRILMLGSGNVGLVVSYQLKQCGCDIVAIADAAPKIGGYGVHAAKVARTGVPFYLSHTIIKAIGTEHVERVIIGEVDSNFNIIPNTEKEFEVDTICLAVGLSPMSQLLKMAGCKMTAGGIPVCVKYGHTSVSGIFVSGDVSGIEEASSAMIEGRIAGNAVAEYLGYTENNETDKFEKSLASLRQGMFAPENRNKTITKTEEGYDISSNLLRYGWLTDEEIFKYPGVSRKKSGIHPVIECTQNIPCNPCQEACVKGCIKIGEKITSLPEVNKKSECIGCGKCVADCPGQAIFLVNENFETGFASVTMPYEFLPLPLKGEIGKALGRNGEILCDAEVVNTKTSGSFDKTALLTIKIPAEFSMKARFYKREE